MQKRYFIVEKGSLDFENVLQNGSFRNCSLKGSLGNQIWFFNAITAKTPFWNLLFLRVFGEPKMVLSRRHYKNTILESLFLQLHRC